MTNEISSNLVQELNSTDPRAGADDLINPLALLDTFTAFKFVHQRFALEINHVFVTCNSNYKVNIRKLFLTLLEKPAVAEVEQVKDAVCVETHRVVWALAFK
jgi:hypothetical protein